MCCIRQKYPQTTKAPVLGVFSFSVLVLFFGAKFLPLYSAFFSQLFWGAQSQSNVVTYLWYQSTLHIVLLHNGIDEKQIPASSNNPRNDRLTALMWEKLLQMVAHCPLATIYWFSFKACRLFWKSNRHLHLKRILHAKHFPIRSLICK